MFLLEFQEFLFIGATLKQKFTDCATIKELNVLWEDYLGVPMPEAQAIELGNTDDEGGALPIKSGLQF